MNYFFCVVIYFIKYNENEEVEENEYLKMKKININERINYLD